MSKGKGENIKRTLQISCRSHIQETTVCATMIYFRGYEYPYCAPIYFIIKRVPTFALQVEIICPNLFSCQSSPAYAWGCNSNRNCCKQIQNNK